MINTDYADDLALLVNTPTQAKSLTDSQEQAAEGIGFHLNTNKIEFVCFKQGARSTLSDKPLKLDQFTYFGSNISSTESDFNIHIRKVWNSLDRLSMFWKSDLTDKIRDFFYTLAVSTIVWMYYMGAYETHGEKSWWELHKNATCCFEQIRETTSDKIAAE